MAWLDFATLGMFALFLSLAYKRGVILEVTDLICFVLGGILAFRLYRPISSGLHASVFSKFSIQFLERFCIVTIFVVTCLVIFGLGLNFQRKIKEEKVLDQDVDQRLGLVVGFFKTTIVIICFLGFLFYNEAFPALEVNKLKSGFVVSRVLGLQGVVKPLIYIIAPSDLAEDFLKKGLGTSNAK